VPIESACSAAQTTAFVITNFSTCYSSVVKTTLKSDFESQTSINGTGQSLSWGLLKAVNASSCKGASGAPPGATSGNSGNTFVQIQPPITGACNVALSGSMVAAYNHNCNLEIMIHGYPSNPGTEKVVEDECPACGLDPPHFDNFLPGAQPACSHKVGDLGYFYTLGQVP
jgi:hypothetical protein